ncbi:hypothetical protein M0813_27698 [Anaeramoeba flamelloides]|uniref:Uncharacterized protein n=1 Tax=Anaeramoeba flamelloides TaxID=1746091 RepID=A0ABQ8XWG9_9EUKA|nr:hypothetical protein M0813_27698 [Anaeramoeba flamelloides]
MTDPKMVIGEMTYSPDDSFVIGSTFEYTLEYEVLEAFDTATVQVALYYTDFEGDPMFSHTLNYCDFFGCPSPVRNRTKKGSDITIPAYAVGKYKAHLEILVGEEEWGCVNFFFDMKKKSGEPQCEYESYMDFAEITEGLAKYQELEVSKRVDGQWMQIGDLGPHSSTLERGTFSRLESSEDNNFATPISPDDFQWCLNGTMINSYEEGGNYYHEYEADIWIGSKAHEMDTWDEYYMRGNAKFTGIWSSSDDEMIGIHTGELNFSPEMHMPKGYDGPLTYGKLNPIPIEYDSDSGIVTTEKRTDYCGCDVDECGVCGGDGTSCATPTPTPSTDTKSDDNNNTIIAVSIIVPIAAIVIIVLIIVLVRQRNKKKSAQTEIISANRFGNTGMSWSQITKDNVKSSFSKSGSTGNTENKDDDDDDFSFDPTDDDSLGELDDSD